MYWLFIVVIGYLLNAIAMTTDKFILTKFISRPAVFAFNVGISNVAIIFILAPFCLKWIDLFQIIISLLAGVSFIMAIFFMYKAVKQDEVSRVAPYIGSLNPVFIFILAWFFLGEQLTLKQVIAFIFIISGGILISWQFQDKKNLFYCLIPKYIQKKIKKNITRSKMKILGIATISAILFAMSYTLTKYIYNSTDFLNGFVWTRFGVVLGSLLLLPKINLRKIFPPKKKDRKKTGMVFLFGQICGGLSFFLINYAFSINSVTLTHALQGLQYVFLFLIILILSKKFPFILKEKITPFVLAQKICAILLICGGLFFLIV
ncbi:MAG: EamA family transporter [Patescibacteria group bacterium]|nr:EamA family transporter [Patescibacteria group bacterium]